MVWYGLQRKRYVIEKGKELPCQECQGGGNTSYLRAPSCQTLILRSATKLSVLEQFVRNTWRMF